MDFNKITHRSLNNYLTSEYLLCQKDYHNDMCVFLFFAGIYILLYPKKLRNNILIYKDVFRPKYFYYNR